jgi:hypothetical protein
MDLLFFIVNKTNKQRFFGMLDIIILNLKDNVSFSFFALCHPNVNVYI